MVIPILGSFFELQHKGGCQDQTERERDILGGCCNQPSKKQCAPEQYSRIIRNPNLQTDGKAGAGQQGDTPAFT